MDAWIRSFASSVGLLALCAGCHAEKPTFFPLPAERGRSGYDWPPPSLAEGARVEAPAPRSSRGVESPRAAKEVSTERAFAPPLPPPAPPVGSSQCLDALSERGVSYVALDELRGVETPVQIRGPLGKVTYWVNGGGPLRLDCRLALALHELGPVFAAHGVTKVRFSGAYVYRTTRGGRLSHHAHGLALDIHEVSMNGEKLDVKKDFQRGAGCSRSDLAPLNRLACALRASGHFEEFLTPDSNADHHDHLHVAVPRKR